MDTQDAPATPQNATNHGITMSPALLLNIFMVPCTVIAVFIDMAIGGQVDQDWIKDGFRSAMNSPLNGFKAAPAGLLILSYLFWIHSMIKRKKDARRIGNACIGINLFCLMISGFHVAGPFSEIASFLWISSFAVAWTQSKAH